VLRNFTFAAVFWLAAAAALQAADNLSGLNIRIVGGQGQKYVLGSRATRGVTVEIMDDLGKPVEGATVAFRLPDQGAGGVFSNGSKTEVAASRVDGRVQVWGCNGIERPGRSRFALRPLKARLMREPCVL
jgi:hypothetical protein